MLKGKVKRNSTQELKDEEVIKMISTSGDPDLFSVLHKRYQKKVFDKCNGLLKDRILASELTQEIFTKTFEKLSEFRGESAFSSWLYSITYNHSIDFLRHKKKLHYPDWNNKNEIPEIIDENEEDLNAIRYERVLHILDQIHPEEKTLLLMKYKDNIPIKLIEQTLQISESAAKMRIKRARARVLYLYKINYENIG